MTPEEIAAEIRKEFIYTSDYGFVAYVAAALTAYGAECAAEMKERCAQVAEWFEWPSDVALPSSGKAIAAAIRNLD